MITADPDEIRKSSKILLPGVGAFDSAMIRINESGLREVLDEKVLIDKVPVLGICLGMQILTEGSEEGNLPGLGWIKGRVYSFKNRISTELRIPHMGWNLAQVHQSCELTMGFTEEIRFYFVHSYFVQAPDSCMMKSSYGIEFDSAIHFANIYGVQFHPEKSHKFGMKLLDNFAKM